MSPKLKRLLTLSLFIVITLSYVLSQSSSNKLSAKLLAGQPNLYPVAKVVDGDTIEVSTANGVEKVRFIGVDTPETSDPRKPVQCYAKAAKAATSTLLTGQRIRLEPDPEDSDRDKYGRLLRYVYLPDGTLINQKLISQGDGFAYVVFPFTKLTEFKTTEATARSSRIGLWASCTVHLDGQIEQTNAAQ